nr:MAG TPA: hypothetical protein [Caudoviricetes sp.]
MFSVLTRLEHNTKTSKNASKSRACMHLSLFFTIKH